MAKVSFTPGLRKEYEALFNSCSILPDKLTEVAAVIEKLRENRQRYEKVGDQLGIPWYFIAVIHNMEAGLNFARHLHNGDPLTARTVHVPAGRPKKGTPPFTWEESAVDALSLRGLGAVTDWSLAGTLYQIEGYNGWGYRLYHTHVHSPYLWSYSNLYTSGKYVADGTWSDTAKSRQCGAAVLLRRMAENRDIAFPDQPAPADTTAPLVIAYTMEKPADPALVAQAEALQRWLNTFPGIFIKVDGVPGQRTSTAYRQVTGTYLPGDPRG
jgi:lysozyme family protein